MNLTIKHFGKMMFAGEVMMPAILNPNQVWKMMNMEYNKEDYSFMCSQIWGEGDNEYKEILNIFGYYIFDMKSNIRQKDCQFLFPPKENRRKLTKVMATTLRDARGNWLLNRFLEEPNYNSFIFDGVEDYKKYECLLSTIDFKAQEETFSLFNHDSLYELEPFKSQRSYDQFS